LSGDLNSPLQRMISVEYRLAGPQFQLQRDCSTSATTQYSVAGSES